MEQRTRWIVRICDEQYAWLLTQCPDYFFKWKSHPIAIAKRLDVCSSDLRIVAVHGKSRLANQDAGCRIDEGVEENAQRIVSAICEQQFLGPHAEVERQPLRRLLILGVHRNLLGREFCQRAQYRRRTAGSVFVEIETHLTGSPFGGRFIRAAIQDCLTHGQIHFHRRTLAVLRCANKPSDSARVSPAAARSSSARARGEPAWIFHYKRELAVAHGI